MRRVGAAAAAVARDKFGRFVSYRDADGAGSYVHMLDHAGSMSRGRPQDCGWRDLIAHEVDAAAGRCWSQAFPRRGMFTAGTLTAT
jgi:hypothetical protein